MITYCFKAYNSKKNKNLHNLINIACLIYNHCIALHKRYYRRYKKCLNIYKLQKHLTKIKKTSKFSHFNLLGSQSIQDITQRIDRAYKLFFKNRKNKKRCSPPSFKKVKKYKSFTLKQACYKTLEDNYLEIDDIVYRYFKSREIIGKIKTLTIKRNSLGDIYFYFVCESNNSQIEARTGKSVGIDLGFKTFITLSTGEKIESPEFFKRLSHKIQQLNRNLSRKVKGSNNYKRAKLCLARFHKKISDKRNNFHWETARNLALKYPLISCEDLCIKSYQKRYGRKTSDLAMSDFLKILNHSCEKLGSHLVQVDRFYASSQLCNNCGYKNPLLKDVRIREWTCPVCGVHHDRDINAGINIDKEGNRLFSKLKSKQKTE